MSKNVADEIGPCRILIPPGERAPTVGKMISRVPSGWASPKWERNLIEIGDCLVDKEKRYEAQIPIRIIPLADEHRTLELLKRVYRKHNRDDMSIGWVELGEELRDGLCEIMGDEAFYEWSESLRAENKKTIP